MTEEDNNILVNQPSSIIFSSFIDNSKSPPPYSKDILSSLLLSKEKPTYHLKYLYKPFHLMISMRLR